MLIASFTSILQTSCHVGFVRASETELKMTDYFPSQNIQHKEWPNVFIRTTRVSPVWITTTTLPAVMLPDYSALSACLVFIRLTSNHPRKLIVPTVRQLNSCLFEFASVPSFWRTAELLALEESITLLRSNGFILFMRGISDSFPKSVYTSFTE